MSSYRSLLLLAGGTATLAWQAQPAVAQPGADLEEIVVTARRREESFQDVPVTMTAFSE